MSVRKKTWNNFYTYLRFLSYSTDVHQPHNKKTFKLPRIYIIRVAWNKYFPLIYSVLPIVKCIDQANNHVRKDVLQFVPIYEKTGKEITSVILSELKAIGIGTQYIYIRW